MPRQLLLQSTIFELDFLSVTIDAHHWGKYLKFKFIEFLGHDFNYYEMDDGKITHSEKGKNCLVYGNVVLYTYRYKTGVAYLFQTSKKLSNHFLDFILIEKPQKGCIVRNLNRADVKLIDRFLLKGRAAVESISEFGRNQELLELELNTKWQVEMLGGDTSEITVSIGDRAKTTYIRTYVSPGDTRFEVETKKQAAVSFGEALFEGDLKRFEIQCLIQLRKAIERLVTCTYTVPIKKAIQEIDLVLDQNDVGVNSSTGLSLVNKKTRVQTKANLASQLTKIYATNKFVYFSNIFEIIGNPVNPKQTFMLWFFVQKHLENKRNQLGTSDFILEMSDNFFLQQRELSSKQLLDYVEIQFQVKELCEFLQVSSRTENTRKIITELEALLIIFFTKTFVNAGSQLKISKPIFSELIQLKRPNKSLVLQISVNRFLFFQLANSHQFVSSSLLRQFQKLIASTFNKKKIPDYCYYFFFLLLEISTFKIETISLNEIQFIPKDSRFRRKALLFLFKTLSFFEKKKILQSWDASNVALNWSLSSADHCQTLPKKQLKECQFRFEFKTQVSFSNDETPVEIAC